MPLLLSCVGTPNSPSGEWADIEKGDVFSGRQEYAKAVHHFESAIVKSGRISIGTGSKLARVYEEQGRYTEAAGVLEGALEGLESPTDHRFIRIDADLANVYLNIGRIRLARGEQREAMVAFESAVARARKYEAENPHNSGFGDSVAARMMLPYLLETGNYPSAEAVAQQILDGHFGTNRQPAQAHIRARRMNDLAKVLYYEQEYEQVRALLMETSNVHARSFAPFVEDIAASLVLLARTTEKLGGPDSPDAYYEQAIEMLSQSEHEQYVLKTHRSEIWYQWGQLHERRGNYAEARSAFETSMALRRETDTQTHPRYADALTHLAGISAVNEELTSATQLAEEAISVLDASLAPTHPRIVPTLITIWSIRQLSNRAQEAQPLWIRIDEILASPMGPWKEDILDAALFYSKILEKAGEPEAARKLDELHARQKARN